MPQQRPHHISTINAPRWSVLCLHGSRQDGELFSQRLLTLTRKLAGVADLHFVDAPHELPLAEGQSVPMRAWWRHWNLLQQDQNSDAHPDFDANPDSSLRGATTAAGAPPEGRSGNSATDLGAALSGPADTKEVAEGKTSAQLPQPQKQHPSGGWDEHIIQDWQKSLQVLAAEWRTAGPFDGLLGFSNGAAATFLLAGHATVNPVTFPGLKFVILAGGYVPQPLHRLLSQTLTDIPTLEPGAGSELNGARGGCRIAPLAVPLELPSLHFVSRADVVVPYEESLELAECFRAVDRTIVEHPLGHCLPQKAAHVAAVEEFLQQLSGGGRRGGDVGAETAVSKGNRRRDDSGTATTTATAAAAVASDSVAAALSGIAGPPTRAPKVLAGSGIAARAEVAVGAGTRAPLRVGAISGSAEKPAVGSGSGGRGTAFTTSRSGGRAVLTTPVSAVPTTFLASAGSASRGSPAAHPTGRVAAQAVAPKASASEPQPTLASKPSSSSSPATTVAVAAAKAPAMPQSPAASGSSPNTSAPPPSSSTVVLAAAAAPAKVAPTATVAAAVVEAAEASEEQREEMEALEAIFMDEYRPISIAPPRFTIHLREAGSGEEAASKAATSPPSRLFSLTFALPPGYPTRQPPVIIVTGPLGGNDPRRHALAAHLAVLAQEAVEDGGMGSVFQVVEAAKEWINTHLPPDVGERREVGAAPLSDHGNTTLLPRGTSSAATTAAITTSTTTASQFQHQHAHSTLHQLAVGPGAAAAATAVAVAASSPAVMNLGWGATALGVAASTGTAAGIDSWWLREEADPCIIRAALVEAAASAPWRTGRTEAAVLTQAEAEAAEALEWGDAASSSAHEAASIGVTSTPACAPTGPASVSGASEWSQRGRWDYVVGLVGKPSAGKSTFFNAVTDPASDDDGARVAAFPFTTIAPNVGRGFCLVPDPAPLLGLVREQCRPLHGCAESFSMDSTDSRVANIEPLRRWVGAAGWAAPGRPLLWRKVPVVVKDVAGLVPGAYQGRGRGNAFLNDLCDADVLIHVVDSSGTTDREGQLLEAEGTGGGGAGGLNGAAGTRGDPLDDVGWVQEELHRWVYDNIRAKWVYVLRKPARLPELFSGYHASRALVAEVLARVGVSGGSLVVEGASLAHWTEAHLHRLVAHFLQARFPILLALNKADMASSPDNIVRIRHALPHEPAVPVSAATERWLCTQRRVGKVSYSDGAGDAAAVTDSPELVQQVVQVKTAVLSKYGSTGAALALTCAVAMRPPRAVFPVADLEGLTALPAWGAPSGAGGLLGSGLDAKARAADGARPGVLRDCVLLKPGSNIVDLFEVLKRPPYQLLEGDFVRAECSALTSADAVAMTAGSGDGGHGASTHPQPQHQAWRVLKKDEVLDWGSCVLRIMTNRRSHWQATKRP